MTRSPDRLAVHLPTHWTPPQALAVHDVLDALMAALWAHYECALLDQLDSEQADPAAPHQPDLFDDELPF
jgi:hypothetical protein